MHQWVRFKSSRLKVIVPLAVGFAVVCGIRFWWRLGDNRGYAPKQPIPFSHQRHAGLLKIECAYCHAAVDRSRHATIPSMNVCMNCHSVVKGESPTIQKMKELVANGESFEWVKVHDMPDFVFFSHKRHIAKGVTCETCHGDVRQMVKIEQVERLNMSFCVECHREKEAPTSCDTCHH